VLYCEMCGAPIEGRAYTIYVDGVEMIVCERCYRKYMSRARRTATDTPLRLRLAQPKPREAPTPQQQREPPQRSAKPSARTEQRRTARPRPARRRSGLGLVEKYEVVEDYAERVRRARERLGLTQKELAQRVKVGENVIRRIESGSLVPPVDLAMRLERVLGVKLLEPVAEEEEEAEGSGDFYLTLGDVAELRED
jgi:putative transcription factor